MGAPFAHADDANLKSESLHFKHLLFIKIV